MISDFTPEIPWLAWSVHLFVSALGDHEVYYTTTMWQLPQPLIFILLLVAIQTETCRTPCRASMSCFLDFMFYSFIIFYFLFAAQYKLKRISGQITQYDNFCLSFKVFLS